MFLPDGNSLAETYRSYKVSTNYFLDWLWSQHDGLGPRPAGVKRLTKVMLKAAKTLARNLKKNKQSIPTDVINSLRDAISKRREALAVYEEVGADDENHEIFIRRLEQTFSILAPFTARSLAPAAVATNTEKIPPANAFASLATLADELDNSLNPSCTVSGSTLLQSQNGLDQSRGSTPKTAPPKCMLEDDERTMRMEMVDMLRHLEEARSEVKQYWTDVAKGILPIPLASWLTNLTFRKLQKSFEGKCLGSSHCFESHCRRVHKFYTDPLREPLYKVHILSAVRFCIISQAVNSQHTVSKFHDEFSKWLEENLPIAHELKSQEPSLLIPLRDPPTEMPESDGDTEAPEHRAVIEIFKHIKRDMNEGRGIKGLEALGRALDNPCERPSERILPLALANIRDPHAPASLELALCMDIFLSSYEGFLWADGKHNKQNCRLQALHLARDIQKSVLSAIGSFEKLTRDSSHSRCFLSFQQELYDALDTYLREKAFDFYHQAPWTAGGHMSEILLKARVRGETLCFLTPFFPCTLHLYNALACSAFGMKTIPLMEDLCDMFADKIFRGGRPTKNFVSHHRRAVWGKKTLDTERSRYLRESNPSPFLPPPSSVFSQKLIHVCGIEYEWMPYALKEFRGRLPTARLDMFRIFNLCVGILERLSIIIQEDHKEGGIKFDIACNTHVMVDVLLRLIDQLSGSRRKEQMLRDSTFPIAADMAFSIEVDQDAKLEQYLWNV